MESASAWLTRDCVQCNHSALYQTDTHRNYRPVSGVAEWSN